MKIISMMAGCLATVCLHSAELSNHSDDSIKKDIEKHSELYAGPQGYYVKMRMLGYPPGFHGSLWGFTIGYQYIKEKALYFRLQGDWAAGGLNCSNKPRRYLHDENIEGDIGFTWHVGKWQLIPYTGYGFHYLIESREPTDLYARAKFKYQTYNIPLGLRVDYRFNHHFQQGLKMQWFFNIDPAVSVTQNPGVLWELEHRYGARVDLPFEYTFGTTIQGLLRFDPFFEWYEQGHSTAVTAQGVPLGIPTQVLTYWGGLLTIGWKF